MKGALQFMYDLKYTDKVMPAEADYNVADGLFKDGKAAMIVNGDWAMADYVDHVRRQARRRPDPADHRQGAGPPRTSPARSGWPARPSATTPTSSAS